MGKIALATNVLIIVLILVSISVCGIVSLGSNPPSKNCGHECGLAMPPGSAKNFTMQYCVDNEDTSNLQWIDVSFSKRGSSELSLLENRECTLIHRYDIVKPEWGQPCKDWCIESFGSTFYFNAKCSSRMPILVACQKAHIADVLSETISVGPWILGLGASCAWLFIGIAVGLFRFYLGGTKKATVKFHTRDHMDGFFYLLPGARCTGMTRFTEMRFKAVRMFVSGLLDVSTDIYSLVLFVAKGQPYFAVAQLVAIVSGAGEDDVFASSSVMWLRWSWKHGVPARVLFKKRIYNASEAFYSMVILIVFLLKTPHMDEAGDPLISWGSIVNYLVSVLSACNAFRETNETRVYKAEAEKRGCWFDAGLNANHFDTMVDTVLRNEDVVDSAKWNAAYGVVAGVANAGLLAICFMALPAWQVALYFFLIGSVLTASRYVLVESFLFGERYGGPMVALIRSCSYAVLACLSGAWHVLEWWPAAGLSPQVLALSFLKVLLVQVTVLSLALQVPLFALNVHKLWQLEHNCGNYREIARPDAVQEAVVAPVPTKPAHSRSFTKRLGALV